ncbi:EamA family transporter [Demequina sp. TTPB684]|uniref:EamA family transporter n=1 Tax=unclassified Demequina TaxID=2620311 RepID=UPI001CF29D89|nr:MULTISPECIES: EamA family transporter [unclassified Demequina]MCB2414065.1 EamA family transporter [Demequina sp. TTPB684]UPU89224.1 EamA family transporter [Demequina sp. TMPB413]
MKPRHLALALLVAVLWGVNFLAIRASLEQFPPFLLVAMRFAIIAIPALVLVPRPSVPWRWLIGYGLSFGTIQFAFLYWGMDAGFPTGLSSLVLQASAPFTVVLGAVLLRERIGVRRMIGVGVATAGLTLVGISYGETAPLLPFVLVLIGALGWAGGNLASRLAKAPNPLHLVLWMSVVPPLPMFALSLVFEGPARIGESLATSLSADAVPAWMGLAYTVVLGTLVGSGVWIWLMSRYPASTVAPFSMLVPVIGIATAALALDERPTLFQLMGGAVVILGVLWSSRTTRHRDAATVRTVASPDSPHHPASGRPAPASQAALGS